MKKIVRAKKKRKQQERNAKLENFRGKNEKEYWRCLKKLVGIGKKDLELPEEAQIGERVGKRREKERSME